MPTWVTHLMIADRILQLCPGLDRRGFCVGSIAPDCNVENADWTAFTPPREVTHWMRDGKKTLDGAEAFWRTYIAGRSICEAQEYAFLMGYCAHLVADALHPAFLHDKERLRAMWRRIQADERRSGLDAACAEEWETLKRFIPRADRMKELDYLEAEYLRTHPESGFLTEILTLTDFPDYLDYLPRGGIVRKVGIMGVMPDAGDETVRPVVVSKEELEAFVEQVARMFANSWVKTSADTNNK